MKHRSALFFLFFVLLASCKKDDDPPVTDKVFDISASTLYFTSEKDASLVVVTTNTDWKAECPADWISLSAYEGSHSTGFLVGATVNHNFPRETTVTITSGGQSKGIKIKQQGVTYIKFDINGVEFTFLPVEADTTFYLDGATYIASRRVYLDSYFISETEITNAQWKAVLGNLPYESENSAPDLPVIVNWNNINENFIPAINELMGLEFRLPTENEWEVAARGGLKSGNTSYAGSMYIDEVAWHYRNSDGMKHDVALKKPNELGLYDMSGNVSEWCGDWYMDWTESNPPPAESINPTGPGSGTEKVIRGGDFLADRFEYDKNSCRIYSRNYLPPDIDTENFLYGGYTHYTGFRLVISKK